MEEVIKKAIEKNITYLCFTEHHDIDFPECGINFVLDLPAYYKQIMIMKEKYKDDITILMGVELGMQQHIYEELDQLIKTYPFDFILASNHLGQGVDPYQPEYFSNISKKEAYTIYFKDILFNVKYYNNFDSYAHLDYVMRYYPDGDKMYAYKDYKVILDQILNLIIDNDKCIEINTAGIRKGLGTFNPVEAVFENYYALGGRKVTIGSDAHKSDDLMANFDIAINMLKRIGFEGYYVFIGREANFIPFD